MHPSAGSVLVVDDDAQARSFIAAALATRGYTVSAAAGGAEALRRLSAHSASPPDFILLDWRMRTPGPVFAQRYRDLPVRHAPIVLITGIEDAEAAAAQIGARALLKKPFDVDELTALVDLLVAATGSPPGAPPAAPVSAPAPAPAPAPALVGAEPDLPGPPTRAAGSASPAAPTSPPLQSAATETAGATLRRRRLTRLLQHAAALQRAVEENTAAVAAMLEAERARPLTPQERHALRAVRWRAAALRLQLRDAHAEFETLRTDPG